MSSGHALFCTVILACIVRLSCPSHVTATAFGAFEWRTDSRYSGIHPTHDQFDAKWKTLSAPLASPPPPVQCTVNMQRQRKQCECLRQQGGMAKWHRDQRFAPIHTVEKCSKVLPWQHHVFAVYANFRVHNGRVCHKKPSCALRLPPPPRVSYNRRLVTNLDLQGGGF